MRFYRLIKPEWAKRTIIRDDQEIPNPVFSREIPGPNTIEGCNITSEKLIELNAMGYNVYWFPNRPSYDIYSSGMKWMNGKVVTEFEYIFVDMDLKEKKYETKDQFIQKLLEDPEIQPTMVVDSGNGVHAYWRISNLTRDLYVRLQMALIKHFNTDESVWKICQLMRYPGLHNTKDPNNFKYVAVNEQASNYDKTYDVDVFVNKFRSYLEDPVIENKAKVHCDRIDGKLVTNLKSDVNLDELPSRFIDLIESNSVVKNLWENPKEATGDRSKSDMKLTNILFSEGYDINEATQIISNSQKALEKGSNRMSYTQNTVGKVYGDRPKHKFKTVSEIMKEEKNRIIEPQINGPYYLDTSVLQAPWRRKELLGLIAGSGVGKTAFALNIIKDIIFNNPDNDDVYVFFSLEMSKGQIIKRWINLVGENSPLTDRLYVIDRLDDNNLPINIGLQEIYEYCKEISQTTGKHIGTIVIDHFHIISTHIDTTKSPNFGIASEQGTGYGQIRNLSPNGLATQIKSLVQTLDTFGILLSQTTKEKGIGDLPIGKDGAYGISQYEWIVDRIITIWQPLMRVHHLTNLRLLAWQYAKIREKGPHDKIQEYDAKILEYNMERGTLSVAKPEHYEELSNLLPQAKAARDAAAKKEATMYSIQVNISAADNLLAKIGAK